MKVIKQPTPNRIRPKTEFGGSQVVDESTNYDRYENTPGEGRSMWTRVNKINGSKGKLNGPGLKK